MTSIEFKGFPPQSLIFFRDLAYNNEKVWFERHRRDYEEFVINPARDFILALGERLKKIAPGIHADPRVNHSLFRLNRDTRFSRDKTPYKTHLALWFWEGSLPRMECSGFYFHLEPARLMLGAGIYQFPKEMLEVYRRSVVDPRQGKALQAALSEIGKKAEAVLGGGHYKKIPSGYDPGHPNAEYLLYNGLYAGLDLPVPAELFTPGLVDFCFDHFREMTPLHRWLVAMTRRL